MQLKNKVAVITGGSKGIGLATAKLFSEQGAKVVITARDLKELSKAQKLLSGQSLCIQGDIANLKDLDHLFSETYLKFGKIDVLFANAGVAERVWIGDVTEEVFDRITSIDYKGTYFTVQKAVPYLNDKASIILNSSIAALLAMDHHSIYSSAKAAVIQMAKTFAADLLSRKIRVNCISPGYIKTPIWNQWLKENPEKYRSLCMDVPFEQRFGTPEEIANVALFLASDASSYMTAQNLVVDGGLTDLMLEFQHGSIKKLSELAM